MLNFTSVRHSLKQSVFRIVLSLVTGLALTSALLIGLASTPAPALADIPISTFPYTQNFDSLSNSSGISVSWTDDTTLNGWFIAETDDPTFKAYEVGSGDSIKGAIYSFGIGSEIDRALGSLSSGGTGTQYYGVRLHNNTGSTIYTITVKYTGEQWRDGGNLSQHKLEFTYQVSPTITNLTEGSWTDVDTLDFTGPTASASATELDGNSLVHRIEISSPISMTLPTGHQLMLRWEDIDDTGFDHGLAIDDLEITVPINEEVDVGVYLPIIIK